MTESIFIAWIEYGTTGDGTAFLRRLPSGVNLLAALRPRPRTSREPWASERLMDASHPWLPIYPNRRRAAMIQPNEKMTRDGRTKYKPEYLYTRYRNLYGEADFHELIRKQNDFLVKWVFSPGVSTTRGYPYLTIGSDYDAAARIVGLSGHGSNLMVWGGGQKAMIRDGLKWLNNHSGTDRPTPYYLIVATCYNLTEGTTTEWLQAFRQKNPIRGVLGYQYSYPGEPPGQRIMTSFCARLGAGMTVIDAWEQANEDHSCTYRWGAIIHEDARDDDIKKISNGIAPASSNGDVFHYYIKKIGSRKERVETKIEELPRRVDVRFIVDGTEVNGDNNDRIGLIPGKTIRIRIVNNERDFNRHDQIKLIFNLYRCDHGKMNVTKLFSSENMILICNGRSYQDKITFMTKPQRQPFCANLDPELGVYSPSRIRSILGPLPDTILCTAPDKAPYFEVQLKVEDLSINYFEKDGETSVPGETGAIRSVHGYFWITAMMSEWRANEAFTVSPFYQSLNGSAPFAHAGVHLFGSA